MAAPCHCIVISTDEDMQEDRHSRSETAWIDSSFDPVTGTNPMVIYNNTNFVKPDIGPAVIKNMARVGQVAATMGGYGTFSADL